MAWATVAKAVLPILAEKAASAAGQAIGERIGNIGRNDPPQQAPPIDAQQRFIANQQAIQQRQNQPMLADQQVASNQMQSAQQLFR